MGFKDIFKIETKKIIIDLIIVLAFMIILFIFPSLGYQKQFFSMTILNMIISILISIFAGLIIYYPLSCGIATIIKILKINKKKKSHNEKNDLLISIITIIIFNPITYSLILFSIIYANHNIINAPCGLEITGFSQDSPAKNAGINIGEIIYAADGQEIKEFNDLFIVLSTKSVGEEIRINTNLKEYSFKTGENQNTKKASLGINVNNKYCKK